MQRQSNSQIFTFEHQIAKLERDVENAKAAHTSLQVQYQEQLGELR